MGQGRKIVCLAAGIAALLCLTACSSEAVKLNEEGLSAFSAGSYTEALSAFDRAIVADNQNASYQVNKGMAYLALGDYENAHNCFDAALRLLKDGTSSEAQAAYRGAGIAYMEEGEYASAMEAFALALDATGGRVSASEYDILYYRGETQVRMGDFAGAVETYDILEQTEGASGRLSYLRGAARVKGGDLAEGCADFDRAVSGSSDYDMYLNCYYCLSDAGYETEGQTYLREALTVSESAPDAHRARGIIQYLLEDYNAALAEFEAYGDETDTEILIYRGLCSLSLGDAEAAYETFEQVLAAGGENGEVYYQMGMCMFSMGEYADAIDYLDRATQLDEEAHLDEILYTQGVCYERLADYSSALSAFRAYVSLCGSSEELDKEIAFLSTR